MRCVAGARDCGVRGLVPGTWLVGASRSVGAGASACRGSESCCTREKTVGSSDWPVPALLVAPLQSQSGWLGRGREAGTAAAGLRPRTIYNLHHLTGTGSHALPRNFPNKVLSFVMLNYALQNVNLSSKPARPRQGHVHRNRPLYFVYLLLEMILVIACRMVTPAFSVSFFVRPLVTQTLRAGVGCHPASRGLTPRPSGKALSLVIKTPFARHCHCSLATLSPIRRSRSIIPHQQHRAGSGSGLRY
jgi:hypothetical protein